MKGIFAKYIPAVFVFSLLFIFINTLVSVINLRALETAQLSVYHTQDIIGKLKETVSELKELEIIQRNYLLTSNKSSLDEYKTVFSKVKTAVSELKALTSDQRLQQKNILLLQGKIGEKLENVNEELSLFANGGLPAVEQTLATNDGYRKTQEIQKIVSNIENDEKKLLKSYSQNTTISMYRTYITILISSLLSIGLVFLIFYLIKRELEFRIGKEKRKDEFVSMATHELKTPITSLQIFVQVLEKRLTSLNDKKAQRYIVQIITQVDRLKNLINDLLDVSRLQVGKMKFEKEYFNLEKMTRDLVESFQHTTDRHKIIVRGKIKQPVLGDEDRISQVLTNLLSNAIKYSPNAHKIVISLSQTAKAAIISIQDFGIGIPEISKANIFERFYRVHGESEKEFQGLGMGLYISQEIIKRHKGKLWFESVKDKGSTFYFSLPLRIRK